MPACQHHTCRHDGIGLFGAEMPALGGASSGCHHAGSACRARQAVHLPATGLKRARLAHGQGCQHDGKSVTTPPGYAAGGLPTGTRLPS
jgi:hypothetical protein